MGVAPTAQLKSGGLHGPTPTGIPGGQLITTPELVQLMQDRNAGAMIFDVLGGQQMLPNAIPVVPASQGGSFRTRSRPISATTCSRPPRAARTGRWCSIARARSAG